MGHIMVKAKFYNPWEYGEYAQGKRPLAQVRQAEMEAMVDTGATYPALPQDIVESLGLTILGEIDVDTFDRRTRAKQTLAVIEIEDRFAFCHVVVKPAGTIPLIGVFALEQMPYKVDPATGKLMPGVVYG